MSLSTDIEKLHQLQTSIFKFVNGPLLEIQNSDICAANKEIARKMESVHTSLLGVNVVLHHFRVKTLKFNKINKQTK